MQCDSVFYSKRRDAQYDSPLCRKAASRRKEQMRRAADNAISQISHIRGLMAKYPDLENVGALELERIASRLSGTTAVRTDRRVAVTFAADTDKPCVRCGNLTTVSPASGLCLDCLRSTAANS